MTDKMIANRVKKLQALEARQAALNEQADAIRAELRQSWKPAAWMM